MKIIIPDWMQVRDAEGRGMLVSMTNFVERNRTDLNNQLNHYVRKQMPGFNGVFDEDMSEDVLCSLNEYRKEKGINAYQLDFPITSGSDIHLIPIGDNIKLKVVIVDEYHGDGDYSRYIEVNQFVITEETTEQDADMLIKFTKKYLLGE